MIGICRLCDENKELIKAHIIPKWTDKGLKQDGHMYLISGKNEGQKVQSGRWDKQILCADCDSKIIGKYDTYAKDFFSAKFFNKIRVGETSTGKVVKFINIDEFDYNKLKLFIVSVLWRASISQRQEFTKVNLGPYEDIARSHIMSGSIQGCRFFDVVMSYTLPSEDGLGFERTLLLPHRKRIDQTICYEFSIEAFELHIKIGRNMNALHVDALNMHPSGFKVIVREYEASSIGKVEANLRKKMNPINALFNQRNHKGGASTLRG